MDPEFTYEAVTVEDASSGRVHRFTRETTVATGAHRLLSDERCQKDQMGRTKPIDDARLAALRESADPDRFCGHCY